jgi:hypothetical protein
VVLVAAMVLLLVLLVTAGEIRAVVVLVAAGR